MGLASTFTNSIVKVMKDTKKDDDENIIFFTSCSCIHLRTEKSRI